MIRRKTGLIGIVMLAMLLLAGCSSGPVREAYTAAGDVNDPDKMAKTSVFRADEDLNVVVTLNSHNRDVSVVAVFSAPGGAAQYSTDPLKVGPTAGKVLLGLDWEMAGSTPWVTGEWTVEVLVDGERENTLKFRVEALAVTPAPAG